MAGDETDGEQGDKLVVTGLHAALLCTVLAAALHRTKRSPTDATRLQESLWRIAFEPLPASRRALLGALAAAALAALVAHAAKTAGLAVTFTLVGTLAIILRQAGVLRLPATLRARLWAQEPASAAQQQLGPLPVWVLTGFLGSGKTTLANRLVRAGVAGGPLLVVENEAGDTSLDAQLIVQASGRPECVLLMNDGCACCKVRGDLCDVLRDEVLGRRARGAIQVGGVLLECSGLADPRAVVQTFLLDDDLRHRLQLREVIAVVDAGNVGRHLQPRSGTSQRTALTRLVEEQIAFATLVLLNKVDRVQGAAPLEELVQSIREVNRTTDILQCAFCNVDAVRLLGGGGGFQEAQRSHSLAAWSPDRALVEIEQLHLRIGEGDGGGPAAAAATPAAAEDGADDQAVRCVSVRIDGDLDLDAFNRWVLRTLSDMDILRAKGVLAVKGRREKLAFQAVHAAFDGTPALDARWRRGEPRFSEVVVIGCGLQPALLELGLQRCRA